MKGQPAEVANFPAWVAAGLIAAGGVWIAERFNPRAAWWLTVLILLSVLIARPGGVAQLNTLLSGIFGGPAPR